MIVCTLKYSYVFLCDKVYAKLLQATLNYLFLRRMFELRLRRRIRLLLVAPCLFMALHPQNKHN
jgi:hypothetical protein